MFRISSIACAIALLLTLPAAAGAAVDVRGSSTPVANTTASTSLVLGKPSSALAGDVLVAQFATNGGPGTISVPAGWTSLATVNGMTNPKLYAYYRVASLSEPASYTFSWSNSVASGGSITAFSGADSTNPIEVAPSTGYGAAATSGLVPGVNTVAGAYVIAGAAVNSSSVNITSPMGMTELWQAGGKVNELAGEPRTVAGETGPRTFTFGASREWAAWLTAIRPAATDTTPPSVTLTAPADGATISGTAVPLDLTATDASGIASVKYFLGATEIKWDGTGPDWSNSFDSTGFANGTYTMTARASDPAGNWGTSAGVSVTIANGVADTTPPTVSITQPTAGATVSGSAVPVNLSASDASGITEVKYYVDGVEVRWDGTGPDWSNSIDVTTLSNGAHLLSAGAKDAAGNWGNSEGIEIIVSNSADTTPPTVSLTQPTAGSTVTGTAAPLNLSASDANGITEVKYVVDGTEVAWDNVGPDWGNAFDSTQFANGTHTIYAKAADPSGNWAISAGTTVTISNSTADTTPPTVSLTAPTNGATVSGTSVNLNLSASDANGVTAVKYYVDGVEVAYDATGPDWSRTWNSTTVGNGTHTIFAKAKDPSENWGSSASVTVTVSNATPPPPSQTGDIVVAAVGDMHRPGDTSTTSPSARNAASIINANPDMFIGLGDFQYDTGTCSSLVNNWRVRWGALIPKTYHIAGPTHDWAGTTNEYGYRDFWNGACAGSSAKSAAVTAKGSSIGPGQAYSFDRGNWHFAMLPTAVWRSAYGGSSAGNAITSWLDADLDAAQAAGKHIVVAYHDPYFTQATASHDRETNVWPWVEVIGQHDVALTLSGSQHNYERSCPITNVVTDACASSNSQPGMVAFNVSTGGTGLRAFTNNRAFIWKEFADTHGWLKLTLHADGSWNWVFQATSGGTGSDSGSRPAF